MPKLTRVAPEIPVADLEDSLAYYESRLGFEVVMKMPAGDYAIVERDNVALHLFQEVDRQATTRKASLHIFTAGIEELYSELQGRGAQITQPITRKPWGNRDFRVSDLCGNEIKFTEPLDQE